MNRRVKRSRRGFSLIELLVVLVILALLVGLVAPRFLQQAGKGQVATAQTQISNFKTAIEHYRLDHDTNLPGTLDDLIQPPSNDEGKWKGPYLEGITSIPRDPWQREYEYNVPGPAGMDYEIRSLGKDGREGGTGEDADISNIR